MERSLAGGEKAVGAADGALRRHARAHGLEHRRLVQYLKEINLYDDTLFVFLSDNGPEGNPMKMGAPWDNSRFEDWGRKGTFIQYGAAWAQVSAGPFRMFKGFQSEGGIRAPMIVAGKGVRGSGSISDALTHVMDVPATILSVAGVPHPETYQGQAIAPLQGKSLVPVLDESRSAFAGDRTGSVGSCLGIGRYGRAEWKLLWLCPPSGPGEWQLYDLKADPGETNECRMLAQKSGKLCSVDGPNTSG